MESESPPVSQAVLDHLARTRGWTLFICVLLWIGVGVTLFSGIMVFVLVTLKTTTSSIAFLAEEAEMKILFTMMPMLYLLYAGLLVYPALKLGKYSSRISDLIASPGDDLLAEALDQQRGFWKSVGIAVIISSGLYLALIGVAMSVAITGTGS